MHDARQTLPLLLLLALAGGMPAAGETLTWEDCVRLAAQHNPAIAASRMALDASGAAVGAARSAMLPQLSAGASADHRDQDGYGTASDSSGSVSISVDQSLYSGGRNTASVRAAQAALSGAGATAANTGAQITYALRTAFTEGLYATEQVKLLQSIETRRRDNAELVELRYDGGREHKGSLASSRAALFDAQIQVRQALRHVAINRAVLCRTIGMDSPPDDMDVAGTLETDGPPDNRDIAKLARSTPAYAASLAAMDVASAQLDSARSGYRPELNLAGAAGRSGDDFAFDEDYWSVGLKVSFPLWSGGRTACEVRRANAIAGEAAANLSDTFNSAVNTLADSLQSLDNALEAVEVQARYLEAAELRADITG